MANSADTTLAPSGQALLTLSDLNTAVNHEPRIEDLRLAECLGMTQPRDIRKLIERHKNALERLGAICATVAQNTDPKRRGRPGTTYWLNKRQCLYLCTKSETPNATEATIVMVEVFDAHLRGTLPAPKPVEVRSYRRAAPRKPVALPPPASVPTIDRDGLAIMKIAGETIMVDTSRIEPGPDDRVVCFDSDGTLTVEPVKMSWPHANWCGRRFAHVRDARRTPSGQAEHRPGVWVIGVVMAALPERVAPNRVARANKTGRPTPSRRDLIPSLDGTGVLH